MRPPNGEPYEVETRGRVSRVHLPQVQRGAVLPVAIDPAHRMKVAIAIYQDRIVDAKIKAAENLFPLDYVTSLALAYR